ncbi:MAG: DUF4384 domain-containing protein, partial [Planctomycetota bacterium]
MEQAKMDTCRGFLIFSLIILSMLLPAIVNSQNIPTNKEAPDQEKRSCIQSVDGYAYLSENMTLAQTRAAAFVNAKRQALEAAKTYIQSKTKVKNFQLDYDLIMSDTAGSVTVLEQKDHGVEGNNRYHVWIKAEVVYDLRPNKPESFQAAIGEKAAPLTVKVWTGKKKYKHGDSITVYVQGNRGFYARIVNVNAGGEIIQLIPNDYRKLNFFEGGRIYRIPDKVDRFELKVSPPYGDDHIVVYASEVPLGEI